MSADSTSPNTGSPEPIDAVYTWVDGDDPVWQQQLERTLANQGRATGEFDGQWHRFRNHDELRFSLRSLERFAPWVRKVHLVTSGQQPEWLNLNSPRLQLVTHDQIFTSPKSLPTFNSHAIELNLHRIPGLSRRFLYMNDDLFFGRSCPVEDFLGAGGGSGYLGGIHLDRHLDVSEPTDMACRKTRAMVEARLGSGTLEWMPAHTPQLIDCEQIVELERQFQEAFAQTSARRFRSPEDFVLRIAYAALSKLQGKPQFVLKSGSTDYSFLRLHGNFLARVREFQHIKQVRPRFFCINDDLVPGWHSRALIAVMRRFLENYFPNPSGFERGNEPH